MLFPNLDKCGQIDLGRPGAGTGFLSSILYDTISFKNNRNYGEKIQNEKKLLKYVTHFLSLYLDFFNFKLD